MKFKFLLFLIMIAFMPQQTMANEHGKVFAPSGPRQHAQQKQAVNQISKQQAAQIAMRVYSGKLLKVSKQQGKRSAIYRVKLLKDNGHIITILVDAQSGKIK